MKKNIYGYDQKEVDEIIQKLSYQNEILIQRNNLLEDELKETRLKLAAAKANLADGMTKADADGYKELKIAYAAMQERMEYIFAEFKKIKEQAPVLFDDQNTKYNQFNQYKNQGK